MKKIRLGRKLKKAIRKANTPGVKKWGKRAAVGVAAAGAAAAAVAGIRRARSKAKKAAKPAARKRRPAAKRKAVR